MKKILLCALMLCAWSANAGWVKISGQIFYAMSDKVELAVITNYVNKEEKI